MISWLTRRCSCGIVSLSWYMCRRRLLRLKIVVVVVVVGLIIIITCRVIIIFRVINMNSTIRRRKLNWKPLSCGRKSKLLYILNDLILLFFSNLQNDTNIFLLRLFHLLSFYPLNCFESLFYKHSLTKIYIQ